MRSIFSFPFPKGGCRTIRYVKGVFSNFDGRIFLLFALLAITGGFTFLAKYQNYVDCDSVIFSTKTPDYEVGTLIMFENETPNAKRWKWDFGDGTVRYKRTNWIMHKYTSPGTYEVTLTLNENEHCTKTQIVIIKGNLIEDLKVPKIILPKTVFVGESVEFDCEYPGEIFSLEWRFGESVRPDATIKKPPYIFHTPGFKEISLVVNGEIEHRVTETIYVNPKKKKRPIIVPGNTPDSTEKPNRNPVKEVEVVIPVKPLTESLDNKDSGIAPDISEEQFERLLIGVANKTKTKEDFADYICEEYDDIEVIKNEEQLINFAELCQLVRGRRIKIKSLKLKKNDKNCIARLEIEYRVRKVLGLLWVKD